MRVHLRFYGGLVELAGEPEVSVPFGAPRSVKDLVESRGVPHPEIGLLLVDGTPVHFDHLLTGGERVAVYPPFRSLDLAAVKTVAPEPIEARFVLDVHLGTLTRRLRLLGFDCWYSTSAQDAQLAEVASSEQRILLTRDRELLMRNVVTHGYCPRSDDPDEQAIEVVERFDLAARIAPMTRCVHCNGVLEAMQHSEVVDSVPPRSRAAFDRFSRCRECGQAYWPGSHMDAMSGFVERVRVMATA